MGRPIYNLLIVYIVFIIDMSRRCLMMSGYWEVDPKYHWSNITGAIAFTVTGSILSPIDCAAACLYNPECLMFGYSHVTGICHGFRHVGYSPVTILSKSEDIFKEIPRCVFEGYMLLVDGPLCIMRHTHSLPWDKARLHCENNGGRLLIIDDAQKYNAFVTYAEKARAHYVWSGANDRDNEGSWVWLNGSKVDLTIFERYFLNDYSRSFTPNQFSADCGMISYGALHDENCLMISNFICERTDLV